MSEMKTTNRDWPQELCSFVEQQRKCGKGKPISPGWLHNVDIDYKEIEKDMAFIPPSETRRIIGIIRKFKKKHENLST